MRHIFSAWILSERKDEGKRTKPNAKLVGRENKGLIDATHALGGLGGGGVWTEEQLPRVVFSPEVPSPPWRARGRGFLTSFVLAPPRSSTCFGSWLVLPGRSRGSEYVCVGPRAVRGRGTPSRLRLARGAVELMRAPLWPSLPGPSGRSAVQRS